MRGKEHPVNSLLIKLREIFLKLSFDEIINPTLTWYSTLSHLIKTKPLPIKLFSQEKYFKRNGEFEGIISSCVIIDELFDIEKGKDLCSLILKEIGFEGCEFKESCAFLEEIEVAKFGFFPKESLDNYSIPYPVFNLDLYVDRLVGILTNEKDLRKVLFPQFYKPIFQDSDIAKSLRPYEVPIYGAQISSIIFKKISALNDTLGPCEVLCYSGRFLGRDIKISAYNWDNRPLVSSYAFNEIWVSNGEIFSLPKGENRNGINTGLVLLRLITDGFVAKMEDAFKKGEIEFDLKFEIVETEADINLFIPDEIRDYITSNNKKILINAPLFFGIKAEME